jgi:predicted unusual protein kinase regulating ubiquinone biosynthesis (AarF/ABC1/UbiB family)
VVPSDDEMTGITRGFGRRLFATGRIAATAARLAARRVRGVEGEADGRLGEALARELDEMKGMAMKVGQILSYFDGVLPPATHAALRRLQQGTRPVAFARMAAVVEAAFGQPLAHLFERFDPDPIASASIGQVYRADFQGRPVAVKVQYPEIKKTMEGDFSRLRGVALIASAATAVDGEALVEELRARLVEECDYQREAQHANAFADAFAADPDVMVPRAILERTRETVITTGWAEGDDFYGFAASADSERRNRVAMTLVRFAYRSLFELAALNADPHPGNYVFPPNGAVAFLDFGCVRRFEAAFVEAERRLARIVIADQRAEFNDALLATGIVAKPERFDFDAHWALLCHQWAPYRTARFRFTREYLAKGMEFSRPGNPNLRRLAIPPPWIWMQRLQFGLHAVLVRLGAEGDFRAALAPWLWARLQPLRLQAEVQP